MFDIGFSEFLLIAVVALIVLGPHRLPGAARTVGVLLRRARNSWANVRSEIERELAAEEIKRSMRETAAAADPREEIQAAADTFKQTTEEVGRKLDERN
ncbi:Sec-independent protein translocase protein TatB [Tahibacter amnicola]|uniref:Sec-independent protein translocase protein TatB n=1 Tax=Tahibacter amnicola TaxID=2976241 RepID=UPI0031BAFA8C